MHSASGRSFCVLNNVDDYAREWQAIEVGTWCERTSGTVLEELEKRRGLPPQILSANGAEFVSRAVRQLAYAQGLQWHPIQPGRPKENRCAESFNRRFRDSA